MHILFAEDDAVIASGLVYALQAEGYTVTHCPDEASAVRALGEREYSLALLDLSLPDGSGFSVFERIRQTSQMPVLFVTAADDEGNTVKALEMGADDYITKPFRVRELLARIKTVLRRAGGKTGDVISLGSVKVDLAKAKVYKDGAEVLLTALEYRLLLTFAHNKGQVLTRGQILESLWDVAGNFVNDNTLTVYIKRLRDKLGETIVQTVRGLGYMTGDGHDKK
ncbi:MAG: response regulator transcription factor [Oscillospiraceae bacterium]|nr:response regulator transcription factor [Oscillospiraceae bacterium]